MSGTPEVHLTLRLRHGLRGVRTENRCWQQSMILPQQFYFRDCLIAFVICVPPGNTR